MGGVDDVGVGWEVIFIKLKASFVKLERMWVWGKFGMRMIGIRNAARRGQAGEMVRREVKETGECDGEEREKEGRFKLAGGERKKLK